jgi:hypothetical protein
MGEYICWTDFKDIKEKSPRIVGLLPNMFPVPRKNQLFRGLGFKWIPITTIPLHDKHQFLCDLCGVKNRAAFPYSFYDTQYDFDDTNSFVRFACPNCVIPRSATKLDTDLATLVSHLERHNKVDVDSPAQFLAKCFGKSDQELKNIIGGLSCFANPPILNGNSPVICLKTFKSLQKILVLCLQARNIDISVYRDHEVWKFFVQKFLPYLVQFREHPRDEQNLIHKCFNTVVDSKAAPVEKSALFIYYLRKGVFLNLSQNWSFFITHVNNFMADDKYDCVFAPRSPTAPVVAPVAPVVAPVALIAVDEVEEARVQLQQAMANFEDAKGRAAKRQK